MPSFDHYGEVIPVDLVKSRMFLKEFGKKMFEAEKSQTQGMFWHGSQCANRTKNYRL